MQPVAEVGETESVVQRKCCIVTDVGVDQSTLHPPSRHPSQRVLDECLAVTTMLVSGQHREALDVPVLAVPTRDGVRDDLLIGPDCSRPVTRCGRPNIGDTNAIDAPTSAEGSDVDATRLEISVGCQLHRASRALGR